MGRGGRARGSYKNEGGPGRGLPLRSAQDPWDAVVEPTHLCTKNPRACSISLAKEFQALGPGLSGSSRARTLAGHG